jgi:hypothetical protein
MPDVVMVDYQFGDRSGLWSSRNLKCLPSRRSCDLPRRRRSLPASRGARGQRRRLLSKFGLGSELCDAIGSLAVGAYRALPCVAAGGRARPAAGQCAAGGLLLAGTAPEKIA